MTVKRFAESTDPTFLMETLGDGRNDCGGYEAVISPCVPDNVAISGQSGTFSGLIFGAWSEAVRQVIWGDSIELIADPFSLAGQGEVALNAFLMTDFLCGRPSLLNFTFFQ